MGIYNNTERKLIKEKISTDNTNTTTNMTVNQSCLLVFNFPNNILILITRMIPMQHKKPHFNYDVSF